ncbi:hypothetical protein BH11PLA1_BH11PLA1_00850 [soil metagenome]
MSDLFYRLVRAVGTPAIAMSAQPRLRGFEHIPRRGPCIIAATHGSPIDVALLIRHTPRLLDFVSITEVFARPLLGRFYGALNAFPLERARPDPATVRTILTRLERGRCVAMFPEGRIQRGDASALRSGRIRPGVGRIATLARVPVIPCVILNSAAYEHAAAWAPLRRTRYVVHYLPSLSPDLGATEIEERLLAAWRATALEHAAFIPASFPPRPAKHPPEPPATSSP